VRVRQEKIEILPRGAGFAPTGRFAYEQLRTRAKVLP
jgi:hypothetical protein